MIDIKEQKGFTLVELAIVLTIVGLLIGGVLKGQQLIQNSRVTATVAQVNAFESATTSFRDAYGELPGDLMDAQSRIPRCTAACDLSLGTTGNNKIGTIDWDFVTFQSTPLNGVAPANAAAATSAETVLYWFELQNAGLISGITEEGINGTTASFGETLPSAKIGGGFWVGNSSGILDAAGLAGGAPVALGRVAAAMDYTILGSVVVIVAKPDPFAATAAVTTAGLQPLTPATAANLDRKMDDGLPNSGQVQAYGVSASCYSTLGGSGTPYTYQESVNSKDCGLIMRLQR